MPVYRPKLKMERGQTYTFDVSDSSNSSHPFRFTTDSGTSTYSDGVSVSGTAGVIGSKVEFTVPTDAPDTMNYYCGTHGLGMGNKIKIVTPASGDNAQRTFRNEYDITVEEELTNSGNGYSSHISYHNNKLFVSRQGDMHVYEDIENQTLASNETTWELNTSYQYVQSIAHDSDKMITRETSGANQTTSNVVIYDETGNKLHTYTNVYSKQDTLNGNSSVGMANGKIAFQAGTSNDTVVDIYSMDDFNTKIHSLRNVRAQRDGVADHDFGHAVAMTDKFIAVSAPNADGYYTDDVLEWPYVYGQVDFDGSYGVHGAGAVHIFSAETYKHLYTIENPGLMDMSYQKPNQVDDGFGSNILAHQKNNDHYLLSSAPYDDIVSTMSSNYYGSVGIVYTFKLLDSDYELILTSSDLLAYGSFGGSNDTTYGLNNTEWGRVGMAMNYPYVAVHGNLRHNEDSGTYQEITSPTSAHYSGGVAVFDVRDQSHLGTIYNPNTWDSNDRSWATDYFGKRLALRDDGTIFAGSTTQKKVYKIPGDNGFFQPLDSSISSHSISVSGANDYLSITGDDGWLNSTNGWTIEYWMKYTDTQTSKAEIYSYNPSKVWLYLTSDEPRVKTFDVNGTAHYTMQYGMRTSGGVQSFNLTGTFGPGTDSDGVPGDDGPTRWHHRAVVYKPAPHDRVYDQYLSADSHINAGTIVSYVDGLPASNNMYQRPIAAGSSEWTIGRNNGYSDGVYIRDFAIHHYPKYTGPFIPSLYRPTIKDDTQNKGTKVLIVGDSNGFTDLCGNATFTNYGATTVTDRPLEGRDLRDMRSYYHSRIWTDLDSAFLFPDDYEYPFVSSKYLTQGAPTEGWSRIDNWSSLSNEKAFNSTTDKLGNIIVSGTSYENYDMFMASYDTYGNMSWRWYWNNYSNVNDDFNYDIVADSDNNAISVGEDFQRYTWGPGGITKMDASGTQVFKKVIYDGNSYSTPISEKYIKLKGVDVDKNQNIVVSGESKLETVTIDSSTSTEYANIFLAKVNPTGTSVLWAKNLGYPTFEANTTNPRGNTLSGTICKLDDSDNIYGTSWNSRNLYDSAGNSLFFGANYALAYKTDSVGDLIWHSSLQTNDSVDDVYDRLYDLNLFKSGDPVLTGFTQVGPLPAGQSGSGDYRPQIVKLDKTDGSIKWQKVFNFSQYNTYTGLTYNAAVDNDGNIFFNAVKATSATDSDAQYNIILKYDSDGILLDQKKIRSDVGFFTVGDVSVDIYNNLVLTGDFEDPSYTSNHMLWTAKIPNSVPTGFYDSSFPVGNQIQSQTDTYGTRLYIEDINYTDSFSTRLTVRPNTTLSVNSISNMKTNNATQSKGTLYDYGQNSSYARRTGITKIRLNTNAYSGDRGIIFNGRRGTSTNLNINQYVDINTQGDAALFGDASGVNSEFVCAVSSGDEGRIVYDYSDSSGSLNALDYINSANLANASYFGDQVVTTQARSTASDGIRGLFSGGLGPNSQNFNEIDYITIATTGNASDFGDAIVSGGGYGGISHTTYGIFQRGSYYRGQHQYDFPRTNDLHYVTIQTTGNSQDFGDLQTNKWSTCSMQDATRGIFAGGFTGETDHLLNYTNTMDYITIDTPGNASDFGDLTSTRAGMAGMSNNYRGVMAGGLRAYNSQGYISTHNEIQYITIQTLGNAQDFGDMIVNQYYNGGSSGTPQ